MHKKMLKCTVAKQQIALKSWPDWFSFWSQAICYQFIIRSPGVTTCACSYLNVAVRQLIKPLYLSNASPEAEHDGSQLWGTRDESSAALACSVYSWLFVFPVALISALQPTWRPTSLEYIDSRECEEMLLCTQSSLRTGPTEGKDAGICNVHTVG